MPATSVRPPEYRRREPEKEPLYQILAGHPETFLQQARTAEHRLPLHVEKEMRAYLEGGILAYGFVRARCEDCGASRAVAFSCRKRGFCPSCCGRRMADTAARLLDDTAVDPLADEEPVLAALTAASVRGLIATGARAGRRLRRALQDPAIGVRTAFLCFASRGFSLHAARRIAGPDRRGLERLCRYVARPPLASGRLRIIVALTDSASMDLSGGGRAAGDAPAEGSAAAAVRVRRLTSSPIRSLRRAPYGGVRPQVPD